MLPTERMDAIMTKTHILLDIDGTINPRGMFAPWNGIWSEHTILAIDEPDFFESFPQQISSLQLKINSELMGNLVSLSQATDVEMHWFTAWGNDTHAIFCPKIGFEEGLLWNIVLPPEGVESLHEDSQGWWKTEAIRQFMAEHPNDNAMWIDDMVDLDDEMEKTNRGLCDEFPTRLAIIGVPGHLGITPDIFNFVKKISMTKWMSGFMAWEF